MAVLCPYMQHVSHAGKSWPLPADSTMTLSVEPAWLPQEDKCRGHRDEVPGPFREGLVTLFQQKTTSSEAVLSAMASINDWSFPLPQDTSNRLACFSISQGLYRFARPVLHFSLPWPIPLFPLLPLMASNNYLTCQTPILVSASGEPNL